MKKHLFMILIAVIAAGVCAQTAEDVMGRQVVCKSHDERNWTISVFETGKDYTHTAILTFLDEERVYLQTEKSKEALPDKLFGTWTFTREGFPWRDIIVTWQDGYLKGDTLWLSYAPDIMMAPVLVKGIRATSWLPPEGTKFSYGPEMAFDGNPLTAWNDGTEGNGVGEIIEVEFQGAVTVKQIEFMAGYFDARWYRANNRVKRVWVIMQYKDQNNQVETIYTLEDRMEAQTFSFPRDVDYKVKFDRIKLIIEEVYPGDQWNDLAISGITLLGENGPEVYPIKVVIPESLQPEFLIR